MSDDDLLTTIRFEVDASGVGAGLTSVKRSISDLGTEVNNITKKTNDALSKVGTKEFPVEAGLTKASKSIIKQTGELEKAIATFGSVASTGLKNAYKDIASEEVRLRGMGIDPSIMNPYLEKLKVVQKVTAEVARQDAKSAAEQAVATQNAIALEEHYASLKSQHAAHNKAISDATAESLREELALLASINDATLRIKTTGRAAATPSTYYEAKAGASPSASVNAALNAMKSEETEIIRLNKLKADSALIEEKQTKATRDRAAALVAYYAEAQNAELNLIHTGRAKSSAMLIDKGQRLGFTDAEVNAAVGNLKKIEAANAAAFAAANPHLGKLKDQAEAAGTSVKGLSASLRNVPAQFTDIVVSLQGGQAPLTVLLQQGGQLRDMFGSTGGAVRALGGYVMGLVNPYTILAGTVGALAIAYIQGAAESEAYNKSLIMTGNAVGTTAGQLSQMAQAVSQATGGTVGAAAESLAMLAGSSNIASSQFEKITAVATQMERVAGVAIKDTVAQFAELGKDPVAASEKLNASTHYLTAEIYHQIKALEDQGDKAGAAALAQTAYYDAMTQRIPALAQNLGIIEKAWHGITGAAKSSWDAMLDIGRQGDMMAELRKAIAVREGYLRNSVTGDVPTDDAKLNALRQQLLLQEKGAGYEAQSAAAQKAAAKQAEASIALSKEAEKNASKQVQMEREIAKVREQYNNSAKSTQDTTNYEASIIGIQKRFKETEKHVKAASDAYNTLAATIARSDAASDDYNANQEKTSAAVKFQREQLDAIDKAMRQKNITLAQAVELESDLYDATVKAVGVEKQIAAIKDQEKALDELYKSMTDYTEAGRKADAEKFKAKTAVADYVKGINASAAALEFETGLMGQSAEVRAMAIEQNAIYAESLQKIADIRKDPAWGTDTAARDTAIVDVQVAAATKAATASGRAALAEWNRTNDRISDGLVSALTKGGKEGAQQVRDLLVKELVMEPFQIVVRALLQPVTQGLTNMALGAVGQATGMDFLSGAGSAASLYSMGSKAYGWLTGAGATESIYSLTSATTAIAGASEVAAGSLYALGNATVPAGIAATELGTGLTLAAKGVTGLTTVGAGGAVVGEAAVGGAAAGGSSFLPALMSNPVTWVAAALLVASTLQGGETRSGAQYSNKGVLGDVNYTEGPSGGEIASDAARAAFIGAQDSINLILKRVGSSATLAGFNAGLESSENGHGFAGAGGTLSTGATFGDTGDLHSVNAGSKTTEVAMAEYVSELRVSVMQALQAATDIPKGISDKLAGIDLNNISQKAFDELEFNILSVIQLQEGLKELPFENLKTLSFEAADGLLAAADALDNVAKNGAESLGILLNSYYTNFYTETETEKTALLTTNTAKAFTDLGLVMPAVDEGLKAAYRSEIERLGALDLSVEANAKAYAGALALQGSVSTLATTFDAAADKMAKALASLQSEVDKYNLNAGTATDITIAQSATDRAWAKVIEKLPGVSGISQVDAAHWLATASAEMMTTVAGAAMPEVTAFLAAFNSLTSATTAAAQTTIDAAQALQDSFSAAGKGIYDFVQDLIRSTATTDQLWATYKTDLVLAQAGDLSASERITTSAQAYLEKQRAGASTTAEAALATARMVSELSALPAAQSYEQDMLAKLEEIAKNTYGLDELAHIRDAISDRNWDPAHKAASVASMAALANTNGWTVAEMAAASGYSMADIAALFAGYSVPGNMGGTATPTTPTTPTTTTPSIGGGNAIDTGAELVAFAESMDWVSTTMAQRVTQAMQVRATGLEGHVTIADMMSASSKPWDAWFATLGVPAFDKGTNYMPEDMLAQVHKGERIIPAADNTLLMQRLQSPQANNDVLVAEIRALRAEVSELRKSNSAENVAIAGNTKNAARRLETFEADGIAVRNDATKPFTVEISA